ncbi:hypothetical protein JKF63_04876 [Porcisia hertigi]|uniref:Stealth protein CR2 conserved region 2 domain-containing protein n=1 Tax=Porcisia hertigi TaxID=2761500 RepID=A0A836LA95_9TRYP|nr:hypothetical protein JKF63_04876 [Porcisia hertigi]
MRLDVVYTYVNPKAPSFERNLKARGLSFEPWRYRDWEELRYALRSLREFVLSSGALAQYHRRHAADVQRLGELGYQVNMSGAGTVDGVVSLVQRVYLVLSDVDHVPAWLDTEKFPELRVVTHADMFSPEDAAWVLPTLNSNVIESGLHHIPGISRFFLYSANDMMLGRQLSFFDLFRPLSPLRQRLHLYSLSRGSEGSANTLHTSSETGRAALLFEPVLHSDTQERVSGYMERSERVEAMRARKEVGSCLFQKARTTLEAKGRSDGWSQETVIFASWATTTAFRLHNPRYGLTPRGAGVSRDYYYYLSSMRLHGIAPPFGYAHTPQLVDREVYRRLNEVEFFDFTNTTRSAYEREMYPYSSIDEYAVFAVAMMRGMERHLWGSMWPAAPADTFADVRGTLKSWWATNVLRDPTGVARRLSSRLSGFHADISMFGALYGNTWGAQLQRPDLSGAWVLVGARCCGAGAAGPGAGSSKVAVCDPRGWGWRHVQQQLAGVDSEERRTLLQPATRHVPSHAARQYLLVRDDRQRHEGGSGFVTLAARVAEATALHGVQRQSSNKWKLYRVPSAVSQAYEHSDPRGTVSPMGKIRDLRWRVL